MPDVEQQKQSDGQPVPRRSSPRSGRPPVHGLKTLRRAVTQLTTRRLDGRSAVAVAVRRWKEDVRSDLGLERRARDVDLAAELARLHERPRETGAEASAPDHGTDGGGPAKAVEHPTSPTIRENA